MLWMLIDESPVAAGGILKKNVPSVPRYPVSGRQSATAVAARMRSRITKRNEDSRGRSSEGISCLLPGKIFSWLVSLRRVRLLPTFPTLEPYTLYPTLSNPPPRLNYGINAALSNGWENKSRRNLWTQPTPGRGKENFLRDCLARGRWSEESSYSIFPIRWLHITISWLYELIYQIVYDIK